MVPRRIAKKVPISTKALPLTKCGSGSSSGRAPYFSGPKKVAWVPSKNSAPKHRGMLFNIRPAPPSVMIRHSPNLVKRISRCLG